MSETIKVSIMALIGGLLFDMLIVLGILLPSGW